jgi:ATP-dependent DNA ligase
MPSPKIEAKFIEPMECLAVTKLPEGSQWLWELKLDGYRAIGVKSGWQSQAVFPQLEDIRHKVRLHRRSTARTAG